jgi:hypothetical protein
MHADGSHAYTAAANISLPAEGVVQDSFARTIRDGHGNTGSLTLAVTVMRPGDRYIGGMPETTFTEGGPTVIDASLGKQTVQADNGDDAVTDRTTRSRSAMVRAGEFHPGRQPGRASRSPDTTLRLL